MYSQGFRTYQDYRNKPRRKQQPEPEMGGCAMAIAKYSVFIFNLFFGVSQSVVEYDLLLHLL